ncbi:MAG: colicin E3/pyocin S6 family cytotoxin, partial [Solirubrobacteraceae bacterium]
PDSNSKIIYLDDSTASSPATTIRTSICCEVDWTFHVHSGASSDVYTHRTLPGFPDARRVKPKTPKMHGKRARWKDSRGRIYEWDYQHGAVEVYDSLGRHLGQFDPDTGDQQKPADPSRRVEP